MKIRKIVLFVIISLFLVSCKTVNDDINPFEETLMHFADGEDQFHVTKDFTLVTEIEDIKIYWKSLNSDVISIVDDEAIVARTSNDEFVTLIASYKLGDEEKNKSYLIIVLGLETEDPGDEPGDDPDIIFTGYYASLNGLTGSALKDELHAIISSNNYISDSITRTTLEKSDVDPTKTNQLLLIYDRKNTNNKWDSGKTWDREHVWPKSKIPGAAEWDLHNLRASTPSVNSSRGNLPFRDSSGGYKKIDGGFYPGDADKGDVARIIFYVNVRWNVSITRNSIGELDMFLRWHIEDPVDEFEINRNQVIFQNQKNRNPFIDHPELVEMIYGNPTLSSNNELGYKINLFNISNLDLLNRRVIV